MKRIPNQTGIGVFDRRSFLAVTGATALAGLVGTRAEASGSNGSTGGVTMQTGNGEWTYQVAPGWGQLPAGTSFGGTHGGIATDKAGHVYVMATGPNGTPLLLTAGEAMMGDQIKAASGSSVVFKISVGAGLAGKLRLLVDWNVALMFGRDTSAPGRLGDPTPLSADDDA